MKVALHPQSFHLAVYPGVSLGGAFPDHRPQPRAPVALDHRVHMLPGHEAGPDAEGEGSQADLHRGDGLFPHLGVHHHLGLEGEWPVQIAHQQGDFPRPFRRVQRGPGILIAYGGLSFQHGPPLMDGGGEGHQAPGGPGGGTFQQNRTLAPGLEPVCDGRADIMGRFDEHDEGDGHLAA